LRIGLAQAVDAHARILIEESAVVASRHGIHPGNTEREITLLEQPGRAPSSAQRTGHDLDGQRKRPAWHCS